MNWLNSIIKTLSFANKEILSYNSGHKITKKHDSKD